MQHNELQTQCRVHLLIDIPLSVPVQDITDKIINIINKYAQDDKIYIKFLEDDVDSGIDEGTRKILAELDSFNNSHIDLHKEICKFVSPYETTIRMTDGSDYQT